MEKSHQTGKEKNLPEKPKEEENVLEIQRENHTSMEAAKDDSGQRREGLKIEDETECEGENERRKSNDQRRDCRRKEKGERGPDNSGLRPTDNKEPDREKDGAFDSDPKAKEVENDSTGWRGRGDEDIAASTCEENIRREEDNGNPERIEEIEKEVSLKTNVENILRLGNASLLEYFLQSLPHKDHSVFEAILAEVSQDLLAKRIPLTPQMQEAVETKLIQLRLFPEQNHSAKDTKGELSLDDVKCYVEMIEKAVTKISLENSKEDSDEVDGVFVHNAMLVARYMHVLKRFLRSTFTTLPWNEMEFCLIRFLTSILKPQEIDETESLVLDKTSIVNHLMYFTDKLKGISGNLPMKDLNKKCKLSGRNTLVKNIISHYPKFEELYNDYDILRNIYSLKQIISSIEVAISVDLNVDRELGKIVIERTLQVLGECLKNTPDSPNVSDDVHNLLMNCAPRQAKNIVTSLRDSLSHAVSLTRKVELESTDDSDVFETVQNDLKKMGTETMSILYRKKFDAFKCFLTKFIVSRSSDEKRRLSAKIQIRQLIEENYVRFRSTELEQIKTLLGELQLEYSRLVPEQDTLFNKINDIIDTEVSRLANVVKTYTTGMEMSHLYRGTFDRGTLLNTKGMESLALGLVHLLEFETNKLNEIVPLLEDFVNKKESKVPGTVHRKFYEVLRIVNFKINRIQGIDQIRLHLSEDFEVENHLLKTRLMDIFGGIEGKLKSENDKKMFAKETEGKIKIHTSKMKLISYFSKKLQSTEDKQDNEINCLELFSDLKVAGKIEDDFRKNYEATDFAKCLFLVKKVNDNYTNLIKRLDEVSVFSVEKYVGALRTFFSFHKKLKPQINKAIDEFEKESRIEIAQFYGQRVNLLERIIKREQSGKETEMAIEMLLLEATEVLEHASLLADNKLFLLEDSPVLGGKALRNYLAHGDPLVDLLPYSPRTAILAHARALVAQGGDLIAQGRVVGRPSKPIDSLEVRERDARRERMVSVQEEMFEAAKRRDLAAVRDCVLKGADPQGRSINGRSALEFAIVSDDIETFEFFAQHNSSLNLTNALEVTVCEGSIQILKHLCESYSVDVNSECFNNAELRSSEKGRKMVSEYMLSQGFESTNSDVFTRCLLNAIFEGHTNTVEEMFKLIENPLSAHQLQNSLAAALLRGYTDIVRILLNHGADAYQFSDESPDFTPLHIASSLGLDDAVLELLFHGASVNGVSAAVNPPVLSALLQGHETTVMILLDHGAEVDQIDAKGYNALHLAAESGLEMVVRYFLDNGFPVDCPASKQNDNRTPLHLAIQHGHVATMRVLLERGADVLVREVANGRTAVHLAAQTGSVDVVREIVSRHPEAVNLGDASGQSPLHLAAEMGHLEVALELLRSGANVSSLDASLHTPLHAAAQVGSEELAVALLGAGAEVDPRDVNNATPLMVSIVKKNFSMSKLLMEAGAEIDGKAERGFSMLHFASKAGCVETVRALITKGADVNCADGGTGRTPLHRVEDSGKDVAAALLDAGARGDVQDIIGVTPLFRAAEKGFCDIVNVLASRCPSAVNIPNNKRETPLWTAALRDFRDVVATLMRYEADVNAICIEPFETALHVASANGHRHVVKQLLKGGACPNSPAGLHHDRGGPLHLAVETDRRDVVNILLDYGADMEATRSGHTALLSACMVGGEDMAILLVERGARVDAQLPNGATALHIAASNSLVHLTRCLLTHGADARNAGIGRTPLKEAILSGHVDVVLTLLEFEANDDERAAAAQGALEEAIKPGIAAVVATLLEVPGVTVDARDESGLTALHKAACCGYADLTEVLLDHDAFPNAQAIHGETPLHFACFGGHSEVVTILLAKGADVNFISQKGGAPLHMASIGGHTDIILLLLEKQAKVDSRDHNKGTPMHIAALFGHPGAIELLAAHGASVNARAPDGATPLLVASQGDAEPLAKVATAESLLAAGANPNLCDSSGRSPLKSAILRREVALVSTLLQGGADVNIPDTSGATLFQLAVTMSCFTTSDEIRENFELIAGLLLSVSE